LIPNALSIANAIRENRGCRSQIVDGVAVGVIVSRGMSQVSAMIVAT